MTGLALRGRAARRPDGPDHLVIGLAGGPAGGPRTRRPRWSTPARVRAWTVAAVLLAGCLAALMAAASGRLSDEFGSMGQRDAPEVNAATGLYFSLNDMDAQVANVLLVGGDAALAADRSQDEAIYASARATADADLQQATVTEAGNSAALGELRTVLGQLGQYEALAADALLCDQQAGQVTAGRAPATAVGYYQQATDLMQDDILPAVGSLTNVSAGELDGAYQAGQHAAGAGAALTAGAGLLLVAALAGLQVFLARRYRRMFNPALAAATVLAVAFTAMAAARLESAASDLTVAKEDAFGSVLALTQARAVSYDANADESRYLVDPGRAAEYQQSFLAKSQELADVGPVGILGYDAALGTDIAAYGKDNSDVRFGGYLGQEFSNITFPGERATAVATLLAYQRYEKDDRVLRATAKANLAAAVAYDIGTASGDSDSAFNAYDAALSSVIKINTGAFTRSLQSGSGAVSGWDAEYPGAAAALIAAATLAGVRPRLAEYRDRA
jgi:hypothetical protein